jgi:CrcB protein
MLNLLSVGIGGFFGAIARYGLSGLVHRYSEGEFPYGTLVVNVLGCLAIGVLMSLVEDRQLFRPEMRSFLMIGLLGSFTTFSTLGYETYKLWQDHEYQFAFLNVGANVVLGITAVALGRIAVRLLWS